MTAGKFGSEEERIAGLEELFKSKVDPVGSVDTMVIALSSSLFGITFIFLAIAWLKHNYRPIRAKNMPLTTCMYFAGVIWFIGNIPMNGHVVLRNGWGICKLWNIWFRVLFCFVFTSVLFSRCYALDRVFNQNRPTRGLTYYGPSVCLFAVIIVYSIVTQAMPGRLTISYIKDYELCTATRGYIIFSLVLLWVYWLIIAIMVYRLRNIQSTFNEFYEFLVICFLGTAALVKTTVIHFVEPKYPYILGYRVAETISDAILINAIILLIIGYPVIMSIVRTKEYERNWLLRLRTDGLQDMYETNLKLRTQQPAHYSQMLNSSVSNQINKVMTNTVVDDDRFFDLRGLGNVHMTLKVDGGANNDGYFSNSTTVPHSPRGETGIQRSQHYDTHSVDSMDNISSDPVNPRQIL